MIQRGIEEDLFRKEANPKIFAKLHFLAMDSCFNSEEFPTEQFVLSDMITEIQNMFLAGLCNEKGFKKLNEYRNRKVNQPLSKNFNHE